MICPVCKSDMIVVEHDKIELDHCLDCHGVWFDSSELELLLESLDLDVADLLDDIIKSTEVTSSEKKHRCPIHGQKMKKTAIGENPRILIDACLRGDGLWFDGGEVVALMKHLAAAHGVTLDAEDQVIGYLGEVIHNPE